MTKKIRLSLCIFILSLGLFFISNSAKAAADHYIRQGATGTGDGSDWTNAMANIPASFVRGDTYYIANGTYSGNHTFNTALSGSTYINIKKATASAHGTDSGWVSTYGDGTATFTGTMTVNSGYWEFDGVTGGGPGNWTSGHGFAFTSAAGANVEYFTLASGVSNVNIRHVFFTQTGNTENFSTGASGIYDIGDLNNSTFEYLYFDNLGALPFYLRNGSGDIMQYNYSGNICGMSVANVNQHCEALVIWDMDNLQFRWNYIAESPSSGGFVKNSSPNSDSIRIYGNYFGDGFPIQCNTGSCSNWRIINNTFNNINGGPFGGDGAYSGLLFYDNLTYSADGLDALRADHDYNWFSKITNGRCQSNGAAHENITVNYPADCDIYPGNTNPFVNSSGSTPESFSLSNTISGFAGTNICSLDNCSGENKYNIDAFGNTRGNDGIWDIGAYEYGVVAPTDTTAPTVPTGLTATAVSASQINLSWSASYDDVGVAAYDIYRNGSLLITTVATSYSNTGLSAGTQYSYTVSARDAAGNASGQSSAVSATTQVSVDTSIPTVPSNLSATAISSSQINLTWSASSDADGVAGYNVYRNGAQIATSSLNNYSDSGLSASTLYSYTVAAFDPARNYSAQTSPVSVTTQVAVVVTPPSGGGGSSGGGSGSSGGGGSSGGSSGGGFGSGIVPPVETPANNTDNTKSTAPANNNDKGAVNVFVPTTLSGASNNTVNQVTSAESATVISHTGYVTFTGGVQAIYDKLMVQAKIAISYEQRKIIANFIQFGTPTTLILGAGERAGTISSFNSAFSRLPISVLDWQDVIKIGSGRWTTQRSATAEAKAEISFKKIYLRNPNMNQANDNAAVNIMAYGLRPAQRNTNSEKIAILSFKNIFKKSPVSAEEWDAVRAIAYSGAKR